jgi:hypothetical protein
MTNRDNFRIWFGDYIRSLVGDPKAGFLLAMVSFPLLERYVRQLTNAEPHSPKFIAGLRKVLEDLRTDAIAQTFWSTYRHGILHNVTMSPEAHGLTRQDHVVQVHSDGKIWLDPFLFSQRVLDTIEKNFETFESGFPLPTVNIYTHPSDSPGTFDPFIGTGARPGQGGGKF